MSASTNPPGVQTSPSRISKSNFSILRYSPFLYFGKLCLQAAQKDSESRREHSRQSRIENRGSMIAIFYPQSSILNRYVFFSSLLENPYMIGNYRCQLCLTQQVKSENIFSSYI